jgi:hypothetical protein
LIFFASSGKKKPPPKMEEALIWVSVEALRKEN